VIARFGMVLYWCALAIAWLCEIAAITVLAIGMTNTLAASEAWIAAAFFCSSRRIFVVGRSCGEVRSCGDIRLLALIANVSFRMAIWLWQKGGE
jgi:hypothetical protein